jgi:integrase
MIIALSGMFKWLLKRDLVTNLPTIVLERPPSGQRDRVLTSDGRIVKLLMLTGQRTGEVAGMRWSDLTDGMRWSDLTDGTWTIPADRPGRSRRGINSDAKNKREHTVPLVPAVRELIRYDHGDHLCDLVFTTNGRTPFSGFAKAKARLDKRLKFDKEWQLRDLRRTVDTGMNELGVEPHIVSAVLNHSDHKRGVAAIYNRARYTEPKRKALERWAAHLDAIISGREEQTVVEMRA